MIRAWVLGAALALLAAAAASEEPARPRAAGGVALIEAAEGAPATVVAEVTETRALDARSYAGVFRVETTIAGAVESGAFLPVAWEEPAPSRESRFAPGDRVLASLETLPGASIWNARIPDARVRQSTLAVARGGNAFLRNPAPGTATVLEHYLALAPADREGPSGVSYLCQLAAHGEVPLALAAVTGLDRRSDLDGKLTPTTAADLVTALLRADAPAQLASDLLGLAEHHRLESLRGPLEALIAKAELAPPVAYEALARIDGGLAPEDTLRLLEGRSEPYRQVVARHARGPRAGHDLRGLVRADPAPAVRASALERLVELEGAGAIRDAGDALHDADGAVRIAAARGLASLGPAAVPELLRAVDGNDAVAARAAVTGLALGGTAEGLSSLAEIAATHPEESVRALARLATGRGIGHTD